MEEKLVDNTLYIEQASIVEKIAIIDDVNVEKFATIDDGNVETVNIIDDENDQPELWGILNVWYDQYKAQSEGISLYCSQTILKTATNSLNF